MVLEKGLRSLIKNQQTGIDETVKGLKMALGVITAPHEMRDKRSRARSEAFVLSSIVRCFWTPAFAGVT